MNSTMDEFDIFSQNPVGGFPLTDGDLVALAEVWWKRFINCDLFCVLTGSGLSGSERFEMSFASDRLTCLEETLGKDEVQRIRERVEERWRREVGDVHWNAYKTGHAIIQDEAAERSEKQAEPSGEDDILRDLASDVGSWQNAETAAIHRWMTTDPDARDWRQIVAQHLKSSDSFQGDRDVRAALATDLRKWAAKEWYRLSSGFLSDLVDLALFRADWLGIADALLSESVNENTTKQNQPEN